MPFHLDGVLFRDTFGTESMRRIFGEDGFIDRFMTVEASVADAEATAGLIPEAAARTITTTADVETLNRERLRRKVEDLGLFSMAIIETWRESIGEPGEYLHWGLSTQDVSDTAMVLQLRDAIEVISDELGTIGAMLADLAAAHRNTPMVGRTQFQAGPPTTFGLLAASWLDEITRHVNRLRGLEDRLYVLQLAGASGTMASLGEDALEIQTAVAADLELAVPAMGWTASRDRFGEAIGVFAAVAETLGRMARQRLLLNRPEIREIRESTSPTQVGSSTNPHKRNPARAQMTVALARLIRGATSAMLAASQPIDVRDRTAWHVEFAVIPETALYLGRMLANTRESIETIQIEPDNMAANLASAGQEIMSEAVMMALAPEIGRQTAHEVVSAAARDVIQSDRSFADCLRSNDRVRSSLSDDAIDRLLDPSAYIGTAPSMVDEVIARFRSLPGREP